MVTIRTAAQCLEGLNDAHAVFCRGELVEDVTNGF